MAWILNANFAGRRRTSAISGRAMENAKLVSEADPGPETVARVQRIGRRGRASRLTVTRGLAQHGELSQRPGAAADTRVADRAASGSALLTSAQSERLNRVLNVLLALGALVLLSPVLVLIALAVKLTSRGPILYAQVRVGVDQRARLERRAHAGRRSGAEHRRELDQRGRPTDRRATDSRRTADVGGHAFRIYKFRSMCMDAECGSGAVWATRNDPRVTAVGRILRHFRLDELPQLYNVLTGDMNIVGPRPERPSIFCRLRAEIPDYSLRQRARPGITGWAQVRRSYDACIDDVREKVRFDLEYLRRRNLWVDLQIMARTIPVMLFKRGAC
jgi:lipopolysaccharide/colanic/teichoic acid biosynthesis glycosyltransferase